MMAKMRTPLSAALRGAGTAPASPADRSALLEDVRTIGVSLLYDARFWSVIAVVGIALTFAREIVPGWLYFPAAMGVSLILAAAFVAGAERLLESWRETDRPGGAAMVHAVAALLCAACGTGLVYLNVRVTSPDALASYLRGPIYWTVLWWLLLYALLTVLLRARQTRERLRERELAAARAELQALRARLDPHFLFNTLHSLGALIRDNPDAAEEAIERFADMMRYVLRTTRAEGDVRLVEEIEFVRDYLALEQLRFGERLRVVEAIDERTLGCAVPALLLQPLVENALRHGIGPLPEGGTVRIATWRSADALGLEVADDGRGDASPPRTREEGGVGLESVRRQLAARFPGRHRFEVRTPAAGGFTVSITVPLAERAPPQPR